MTATLELPDLYTPVTASIPCPKDCTCPWWYWYDTARGQWYVARTCGGSHVWVSRDSKYERIISPETRAELLAHRLNHLYGLR
jgi:hypothetical protein